MVLSATLMFAGIASAQQSKADNSLEFNPHWYIQAQGGVGYTRGEGNDFTKLLSPAAGLNVGYNFSPVAGARIGVNGWQGKGYHVFQATDYSFNFVEGYADLMFNISNLIGGYKHNRTVSFIPFFGLGGFLGLQNEKAPTLLSTNHEMMRLCWDPVTPFFAARGGMDVDFRLTDKLSLNLEGVVNGTDDRFNSKDGDNIDWQIDALLGLTYRLGATTRDSKAYAAEKALADAIAAAAAAEEAARLAKEEAAKNAADAQKALDDAEKAREEAADAARRAAEAEAARLANKYICNVFFTLDSSYIRAEEKAKLDNLAAWLQANPSTQVELVGYADVQTGNPTYNQGISDRRAKAVTKYLKTKGISEDRIITDHKGDTVQPFAVNDQNRVVICTVE